jgi:hypothetical protein
MPLTAYLKLVERDFAGALKVSEAEIADPDENRSRLTSRAAIHVVTNDTSTAQNEIEKTRALLEARLRERPDDGFAMLHLSWVNLALKKMPTRFVLHIMRRN